MGRTKKGSVQAAKKLQVLPGMTDILPGPNSHWEFLVKKIEELARGFGFSRIETPVLELASLYKEAENITNITFADPEGDRVAIRPEVLPGMMRAVSEYQFPEGVKVAKWYYVSPIAYYEEKQKKYFTSWEYGFELFGEFAPLMEAQVISLAHKLLTSIGLQNLSLEINSVGKDDCRGDYEETLKSYLQNKKYELCNDCVAEMDEEPLHVFRCKNLECRTVAAEAPQIVDSLDEECRKHFMNVLEGLDELGIPYNLNPMLVGKEGSSQTVLTFKAQDEQHEYLIGEGTFHDEMEKEITSKQVPCFGFSGHVDVLQKALVSLKTESTRESKAEVFLVPLGDLASKKALRLFSELWDAQIVVHDHFGDSGVKNQLKLAETSKAVIALIMGQKEAMDEMVILRDVKSGMQEVFQYERIIEEVKKRLGR